MKYIDDIRIDELIAYILDFTGIKDSDLGSKSRKMENVTARVLLSYCLLYFGIKTTIIGKIVLRDHSSVIHYKKLIQNDHYMQRVIKEFSWYMQDRDIVIPGFIEWSKRVETRVYYKK